MTNRFLTLNEKKETKVAKKKGQSIKVEENIES